MFYSSFNKKKTKLLKYTAKACNTQKKKTYNTEIEEEKTYDTEIEERRRKKKTLRHKYRPPSIPSLDLDIFIDYENYKNIGYNFCSSL